MNLVTLEDVLTEENIKNAMEYLGTKNDSAGIDGIHLSELPEFWEMNKYQVIDEIKRGKYNPGIVRQKEIVGKTGKRRIISIMNSIDRLLLRALVQILNPAMEDVLADGVYAYRLDRGTQMAAEKAASYLQSGNTWVAELDIRNFFDSIPHGQLLHQIRRTFSDEPLIHFIFLYICCMVERDGEKSQLNRGIIQGSPLSPVLSNLYLSEIDFKMEQQGKKYIRYGDDINVYCRTFEEAVEMRQEIEDSVHKLGLSVNEKKGGVFLGKNRKYLGFEFFERKGKIFVKRVENKSGRVYTKWTRDSIQKIDDRFHLVNDGILTKKDFTALFENEDGKYYLPVENFSSLNVYSDVIFTSSFFDYMNREKLEVNIIDRFGNKVGTFMPQTLKRDYRIEKAQIGLLDNKSEHLKVAKKFQNANIFNLRAVLRYYERRNHEEILKSVISEMTDLLKKVNEAKEVSHLMMYEAQARQKYFHGFNEIVNNPDFYFVKRTRRPPKDALNAMLSFGNTLLYQRFASEIYRSKLDIRFGILHNSFYRAESLNLDLADLFKPILVDRTIFTLVNRKMITCEECFQETDDGGVYLNQEGKRIFLQEFQKKILQKVEIDRKKISYEDIMSFEIKKLQNFFTKGIMYQPFRYVN